MTKPLFMWAGGKTRLLKHYIPFMPDRVKTYIEPFFGGGAVFLYVYTRYKPNRVIINDINADIINIYRAIRDDVTNFTKEVDLLEVEYLPLAKDDRKKFYFALRNKHAFDYESWSKTKEAAVLYFLMKTGFNGIYQINKNTNGRFGTPSGLLNQKDRVYDKDTILFWHTALQKSELYCTDWSNIDYSDEQGTFIFLDPPYRGSFTSYGQEFDDTQHRSLVDKAAGFTQASVFLSNRDVGDGFFDNARMNQIKIPVVYTAGRRKNTTNGYEAKQAIEILLYKKGIM